MADKLTFRISSALKDIIGKDLITDDNIAVFELVKNSFDAYATRVDIYFENIYDDNTKIIIKDNGKGMDRDDLENKWLFVAYSAKQEGTEDDSFDYRDNIYQNRTFAGAKGIGRFSCDRLGTNLRLETTKKKKGAKTEILITDWEKFEADLKDEFINITVLHETKKKTESHGTILEISGLRSDWNREKLLKLKDSLAKLINPSRGKGEHRFKIIINVPEEIENDKRTQEYYDIVNGEVKNFIFEAIELKTTQIVTEISGDGKFITSELKDGGTLIYKLTEKNDYKLLSNIGYKLFYLNQSAKLTFAHRMGVSTTRFGNIFLYKNDFRIYPFGEPGEDPLKLNARYAQGYNRYLGLRNLIGRIEISGDNNQLRETTSRGDGLIKTPTYEQLVMAFEEKALKRLERYVIDVQQWGLSIEENLDELDELSLKTGITDLIAKLTNTSEVVDIEYGDDFVEILRDSQSDSALTIIENLKRIAKETNNDKLLNQAISTEKKLNQLIAAKEEAEKQISSFKEELQEIESENLFLRSVKSQDFDEIVSFLHHIGISSGIIDNYLSGLYGKLKQGQNISKEKILEILKIVVFENKKIQNISKFATKANFKLYTDAIELNLDDYLREYIRNVVEVATNDDIKISFKNNNPKPYIGKFRPIEINILIDNLFSNSKKAGAKNFDITLERKNGDLVLKVKDNGKGIEKDKLDEIFRFGYTTLTEGAGIGLFHIKEILDRIGGDLAVESEVNKGTTFIIKLK